jgi:hypothetical protein
LADRLYLNDGSGHFIKSSDSFANVVFESASCVAPVDFDMDGDQDLFVGTRLLPGVYGIAVNSYLWQNNGRGQFEDVTKNIAPGLQQIGLVTDASWADMDNDQISDLVVVGEWMPVSIFKNDGHLLSLLSTDTGLENAKGLWACLEISDLDLDGDMDLILGNHGMNTRLKASKEKPLTLYINDFDNNKSPEQIMTMYNGDKPYPLTLRNDLVMQMPGLKKKYLYYSDFREQMIEEIIPEKDLRTAAKSQVTMTASAIAWNEGNGSFTLSVLPAAAQFAPVFSILVLQTDSDDSPEILLGGNFYRSKPEIGMYDASYGLLLDVGEDRLITPVKGTKSGVNLAGEIRDMLLIDWKHKPTVLVARNNDSLIVLQPAAEFVKNRMDNQ